MWHNIKRAILLHFGGTEADPGSVVVSSHWCGQRGELPVLHHSDGCVQLHYARAAGSPSSGGRISDSLAPLAQGLWPRLTGQGLLRTQAWLLTSGSVARSSSGQTNDLWRHGSEWMPRGCTLNWPGFSEESFKRHNMLVLWLSPTASTLLELFAWAASCYWLFFFCCCCIFAFINSMPLSHLFFPYMCFPWKLLPTNTIWASLHL